MKLYLLFALLIIPLELLSLNLYELDPNKEYLKSGQKLMDLDFGLHDLEANQTSKEILISIHGRDSRGFEWIYPLQTIDNDCLLYTSPSPRDLSTSRMPSSA